jgi:hypothetical protein
VSSLIDSDTGVEILLRDMTRLLTSGGAELNSPSRRSMWFKLEQPDSTVAGNPVNERMLRKVTVGS